MKKYKFTDETMYFYGCTLHRIQALRSFSDVKEGDLGGWIEHEDNLSQEGKCWVYGDAQVFESARVYGDAEVAGSAKVYGDADVFGSAFVCGNAQVFESARVYDDARVFGSAEVYGDAEVAGSAKVYGDADVFGSVRVYDNTWVAGSVEVYGDTTLKEHALVTSTADYLSIGPLGSRNDFTTFYRNADGRIMVTCGCFNGDLEAFEQAVTETHGESEHGKAYRAAIYTAKTIMTNKI